MVNKSYALITPARNEEIYIEKTIQAIISQSILPKKWVIVSDGSTDGTNEIIVRYEQKFHFIQLIQISECNERNFGSKVNAFIKGYEQLKNIEYDFLGNLDADVSFNPYYYESVLEKFWLNKNLGIAGGMVIELSRGKFRKLKYSVGSVAGAIQMFHRQCYKDIGGYIPLKYGGVDAFVEVMARMKGWEVRSFPEIQVYHHRPIGYSNGKGLISRSFHVGKMNYSIGYHPLFYLIRCLYKVKNRPYISKALLMMCGYLWAWIRNDARVVSNEFIRYFRHEQIQRLQSIFANIRRKN